MAPKRSVALEDFKRDLAPTAAGEIVLDAVEMPVLFNVRDIVSDVMYGENLLDSIKDLFSNFHCLIVPFVFRESLAEVRFTHKRAIPFATICHEILRARA